MEREKFVEIQRKFESKRRELIDKEKTIQSKQFELETRLSETSDQKVSNDLDPNQSSLINPDRK